MKNTFVCAIFVCLWSQLLFGDTVVTAATQWSDLAPIHLDGFNAGYQILVDRQSDTGFPAPSGLPHLPVRGGVRVGKA